MRWWVVASLAAALVACGGGKKSDEDASEDVVEDDAGMDVVEDLEDAIEDPEEEELPPVDPCPEGYALVDGLNEDFEAGGEMRDVFLILPDGESTGYGPWTVIFMWHDREHTMEWMREETGIADLAGTLDFPYIAVLPIAASRSLPTGLGWEMLQVEDPDTNPDVLLFDGLLACIDETFGVDEDEVHVVGFSTGAIMTNLLSMVRNDVIASTVAYSGSFYSDPEQQKCLGTECTVWPEGETDYKFTTVVLEGGVADYYDIMGMLTLDFNADAVSTLDYLGAMGHEIVYCPHTEGHMIPADFHAEQFVRFFRDHPRGMRPSPYRSGMPTVFPGPCMYMAQD